MPRLAVLCLLLALMPPASAQTPKQDPAATFTRRTELVLVPVVVQRGGKHVPNLKAEQFTLEQDGKRQKIATFEEVSRARIAAQKPKLPPDVHSNVDAMPGSQRLVIVALDALNTPFLDQGRGRAALVRYVANNVDPEASIALVTITRGGVKILHDFTTNSRSLLAALKAVAAQDSPEAAPVTFSGSLDPAETATARDNAESLRSFLREDANLRNQIALQERRIRVLDTLAAFRAMAQAFAGLPGRKSLVWITGGLPLTPNSHIEPFRGNVARDRAAIDEATEAASLAPEFNRTWQQLTDANIAVYPVDSREIVPAGMVGAQFEVVGMDTFRAMRYNQLMRRNAEDSMRSMALSTGGQAFVDTADLSRAIRESVDDSASYYLLSYYLDPATAKPGWHKLSVKTSVDNVRLRHRGGFFIAKPGEEANTRVAEVQIAASSPLEFTAVPILLKWEEAAAPSDGKRKVRFHMVVPPEGIRIDEADGNHMKVQIVGALRDAKGQPAGDFVQTLESKLTAENLAKLRASGLVYSNAFDAAPGEYTATVVVRDVLTGRVGSVVAPLTVEAKTN